jgi:hypothetical protein
MKKSKILGFSCLSALVLLLSSCIFTSTKVKPLDKKTVRLSGPYYVYSSTKIHLIDGSVVVFPKGFEARNDTIRGEGKRYALTRQDEPKLQNTVLFDSIACIEYYQKEFQFGAFLVSLPPAFLISVAIYKAIFGSCPTIYSCDDSCKTLEAEAFSYSISSRFEQPDLDRLEHCKPTNGELSLIIANEALETHYINQLALICVEHPQGFQVFPRGKRDIILFGEESPILEAKDKLDRDALPLIQAKDTHFYQSDSILVDELTQNMTRDWLDIRVKVPQDAKKMCVALRLRNTLLNTVLLYDVMLKSQGLGAIEWLGEETSNPLYALKMTKWYREHFGLNIQLFDGEKYRDMARIADTGPIAWHEEAVELPLPKGDIAKLRLEFLPDNWVIDWVGVSFDISDNYRINAIDCAEAGDYNGDKRDDILTLIKEKDDAYLITYPTHSYRLKFKVGEEPAELKRTFFVKSEGFYIEWLRKEWLESALAEETESKFELNDETIMETAELWKAKKPGFEELFYNSKIPGSGGVK